METCGKRPLSYEPEFYQNVAHGRGLVSGAAINHGHDDGKSHKLIGFVTARFVLPKESEMTPSLILEFLNYVSSIQTCRAAYLHMTSYNFPAIHLYKKTSFKCIWRLPGIYLIDGKHYNTNLFVYFVKGCQHPCSPVELVMAITRYVQSSFQSITAKLRSSERKVGWTVQM
ncbi:hypothetical protein ACJRO7_033438 [Eucalyptus globulus]|uniref:histone acetyltransferase n=1 Tax=Eucalyptus globulus TaxID=34317 RepID=A0ABD3JLD1_EUCGL